MVCVTCLLLQVLDLSDPKTYRDFSKPMGAQSAKRLNNFQERYRNFTDPMGECVCPLGSLQLHTHLPSLIFLSLLLVLIRRDRQAVLLRHSLLFSNVRRLFPD